MGELEMYTISRTFKCIQWAYALRCALETLQRMILRSALSTHRHRHGGNEIKKNGNKNLCAMMTMIIWMIIFYVGCVYVSVCCVSSCFLWFLMGDTYRATLFWGYSWHCIRLFFHFCFFLPEHWTSTMYISLLSAAILLVLFAFSMRAHSVPFSALLFSLFRRLRYFVGFSRRFLTAFAVVFSCAHSPFSSNFRRIPLYYECNVNLYRFSVPFRNLIFNVLNIC